MMITDSVHPFVLMSGLFSKFTLFFMFSVCVVLDSRCRISAMKCELRNETLCNSNNFVDGCNITEECKPGENAEGNHCYVLWQLTNEGNSKKLKAGCWFGSTRDCVVKKHTETCIETHKDSKMTLVFCCCEGSMCNKHMSHSPLILSPTPLVSTPSSMSSTKLTSNSMQVVCTLLYTLVPFMGLSLFVTMAYWTYRRHKMAYFNEVPTSEPTPLPLPSPLLGLRPVQLLQLKAQGRFGSVWKAQIMNDLVAVKIFPPQDKNSWLTEQEVYNLPHMNHPDILAFIGAEKRGDGLQTEYWLITAFHEKGSLSDYLKANVVSWAEVLSISDSIAKGLNHIHEEILPRKEEPYKPAIAHRDFKSKNVLLKSDMTACIADFGLALIFDKGKALGDAHGQVGTRRYMAPEVLEGAISFAKDSFIRIDMYACGLVLWELISRCSVQEGPVDEYSLPFEEEVGQHPTLEDMQEAVVQQRKRPKFKDHWKNHPGLATLCDTIEECWDHEAEARLSASCVQERISLLYKTVPPYCGNSFIASSDARNMTTSSKLHSMKTSLQSVLLPKESSI